MKQVKPDSNVCQHGSGRGYPERSSHKVRKTMCFRLDCSKCPSSQRCWMF